MAKPITVYCDGLCEPVNPGGTACFGWVVYEGKKRIARNFGVVCSGPGATNNLAEYVAVLKALEWLLENGCTDKDITVCSDSQLCIYQLQGIYAVRSPKVIPLYNRAVELAEKFSSLSFKWIPREQNEEADKLSRKAYEKHMSALENTREHKAKQIAPNVIPLSDKKFRVPSQTYPGVFYLVNVESGTCTCPDFQMRGRKIGYCKHLLAVRIYLSEGKESDFIAL